MPREFKDPQTWGVPETLLSSCCTVGSGLYSESAWPLEPDLGSRHPGCPTHQLCDLEPVTELFRFCVL